MISTRTLVAFFLALAACGGETPPAAAPEPPPAAPPEATPTASAAPAPPPPVAVGAMKLVPPKGKKEKPIEVKDDGSVLLDGKPAGKFVDNTLVDTGGKPIATVAADGTVTTADGTTGKFGPSDELTLGTTTLVVNDDGSLKITKDGKEDKTAIGKFEGFAPKARRAAALVIVALVTTKPAAPPPGGAKPPTKSP